MKFKVGDKVRVRKDLEIDETYKGYSFVEKMKTWWGMLAEIKFIYLDGVFRINLDEGRFFWTDEMLEPVPDDSPDDAPLAVVEGPDDSNRSIYTPVTQTVDNVNHPQHYKHGEIETLDIIRMSLTAEEFQGFLKGNVLKYQMRAPFKHADPTEDYKKAKFYYNLLEEEQS